MHFCSHCGSSAIQHAIPDGDDRHRYFCDDCGTIFYENPKIIAGCLPIWGQQILLCRRAIEPRKGFWTLPAGFMELGETVNQAACRETREEANADVEIDQLYTIFNLPHISQVYMFFRARMLHDRFHSGAESLETRLFSENEIPWQELAFPTVTRVLELYFKDRLEGHGYPLRIEDITRRPGNAL